jgi:hypothetical protein
VCDIVVPPESTITSTFPPVDGPTPGTEYSDPCGSTSSDPFRGSSSSMGHHVRRSSDLSRQPEEAVSEVEKGGIREGGVMPIPLPSPEPPMCTLVVDDDRLVLSSMEEAA